MFLCFVLDHVFLLRDVLEYIFVRVRILEMYADSKFFSTL